MSQDNNNKDTSINEPPLDIYENDQLPNVDHEKLDGEELAALNTLSSMQGVDVDKLPAPPENAPVEEPAEAYQHPVALFIQNKIDEINRSIQQRKPNAKPITLSSSFAKIKQTEWFGDYNTQYAGTPETLTQKLFAKTNGYFYKEDETVQDALLHFGISGEQLSDYSDKFEMVYFGNTQNRAKPENGRDVGSKSFVMRLKNPEAEDALSVINAVDTARARLIQQKLDTSPTILDAQQSLLEKYPEILHEEIAKTGKTPFTAAGDVTFLQPTAVRHRLNDIPEIAGMFAVTPLQSADNKAQYFGFSEQLQSYFSDHLKVCKIETKDPVKMPQEKLEQIITTALQNDKGNLLTVPKEAMQQRTEPAPDAPKDPSTPAATSDKDEAKRFDDVQAKKTIKDQKNHLDDEEEAAENRKKKESERKSLAEIALNAASKIAAETLKIILALALAILKMVMALLAMIFRLAKAKLTGKSNDLALKQPVFKKYWHYKFNWNSGATKQAKAEKELAKEKSDPKADIAAALDAELKQDLGIKADKTYKSELDRKGATGIDVIELAKRELLLLEGNKPAELKQVAADKLQQMTVEQKTELLNQAKIPALHKIDKSLEAKLAPNSHYSDEFGVLLAKNDKVATSDSVEYGVLAAQVVAGKLIYTLARESSNGNYEINFEEAEKLKLLQHNAVNFDNETNLIAQSQELLKDKFSDDLDKIQPISLLDHAHPTDEALTISQVSEKLPIYDINKLGVSSDPVSIEDLLKDDHQFKWDHYSAIPQLHVDESKDQTIGGSGNHHPIFGHLLDINDVVKFSLPNGDMTATGSVYSAYVHKNDLYYALRSEGGTYSVKADEVSLQGKGNGSLPRDEIRNARQSTTKPEAWKNILPQAHKRNYQPVKLYTAGSKVLDPVSVQFVQDNSSIDHGLLNVGILPLAMADDQVVGAHKHISFSHPAGHRVDYISIGETIDPNTGLKRALCVEAKQTVVGLRVKPLAENRFVQLNLDDTNVTVQQENFNSPKVRAAVQHATEIYQLGAMRKDAELTAAAAHRNKQNLMETFDRHKQLAKEAFVANEIITSILNEKAATPAPAVTIGVNAILTSTEMVSTAIEAAISQPESRAATPSQTVAQTAAAMAATAVAVTAATTIPSIADFIDTSIQANPLNTPAIAAEPEQLATAPAIAAVMEQNEIQVKHVADESISKVLDHLDRGSLPDRLARVALAYLHNDFQNTADGTLDLINTKTNIKLERDSALDDAREVSALLAPHFAHVQMKDGVIDFTNMQPAEFNNIVKHIQQDETLDLKIELLNDQVDYLSVQTNDHLKGVVNRLSQLGANLDPQSLPLDSAAGIRDLSAAVIADIQKTATEDAYLKNFIGVLAHAKDAAGYGEVMLDLANSYSKTRQEVEVREDAVHQAFNGRKPAAKKQNSKDNELEI